MSENLYKDCFKEYVECPYCGEEHYNVYEEFAYHRNIDIDDPPIDKHEEFEYICNNCGKTFLVEINIIIEPEIEYSTSMIDEDDLDDIEDDDFSYYNNFDEDNDSDYFHE